MRVCCIKTCKSSNVKDKRYYSSSFFSVPAVIRNQCPKTLRLSDERRKRWLKAIKLTEGTLKKYHKVCNRHFYTGWPAKLYENSNVDWIPTLYLDELPPPLAPPYNEAPQIIQPSTSKQNEPIASDINEVNIIDDIMLNSPEPSMLVPDQTIDNENEQQINDENDDMEIFEPMCVIKEEPCSEWTESVNLNVPLTAIQSEPPNAPANVNVPPTVINNNNTLPNILSKPYEVCLKSELEAANVEIERLRKQLRMAIVNGGGRAPVRITNVSNANANRQDVETQTIFRVCLKFELESANFEIDKLKTKMKELEADLNKAHAEIRTLNGKIGEENSRLNLLERETRIRMFHKEFFSENNEKVKFFTGLETLDSLTYVSDHIASQLFKSSKLTPFQQCVMTLMKMRLAPSNNLLMYIFDVSSITVSRIFHNSLKVLREKLFELAIKWPERSQVLETTPAVVRERFGSKFVTIVDYLEVMADKRVTEDEKKPNYTKHTTIKYLIAFTPLGIISFVSKGFDGPFTFHDVISQSGLLEKHSPGDIILSNRRIDTEELGFYCATVKFSSCRQKKAQLEPYSVDSIREIKIHVDKVINYLRKKYTILQSKFYNQVEQDLAEGESTIVDKMVHVACALTNLCPTVVPVE